MSRQVRRSLALALAGLLGGLGLVLALFGGESLRRMIDRHDGEPPAATAPAPSGSLRGLTDPGAAAQAAGPPIDFRDDRPGAAATPEAGKAGAVPSVGKTAPGSAAAVPDAAEMPRFDIVRVEPNGDAVVAGRGAPDAVIEMLLDGKPVATAKADANGQFALVPPALPTGSSALRLRMTGRDGRVVESRQSVAVEVASGRDRQPLVALTAPDAATIVLSQPGAAGRTDTRVANAAPPGETGSASQSPSQSLSGSLSKPASGAGQAAQIVSVDVQDNGRLFVTVTGIPGAALRLYLNDTLIAPGSVGPDGKASFTIGRGVKPGQYQVRIDQIEPGTGKVAARAEVPLAVPEPTRVAAGEGGGRDAFRGPAGRPAAGGAARAPDPQAPDPPTAETPSALSRDSGGAAGAVFVPEITTARITRGDNLWRISQRTYGRGERYTVIYDANQSQIRDPDRIYPGQIFILPTEKRG